jgi:hypothetical protein
MTLVLVCVIILAVWWTHHYQPEPPSVPTAPPVKKVRPPRRPTWVAEIRMGKFKPPKLVKVEANSEAEAVMKLISQPHSFNPRDIGLLKPMR